MSDYSLDGYLAAVLIRAERSIIVEGPSDRDFLTCLLEAQSVLATPPYVVDPVEMITDALLVGGNRDRVENAVSVARDGDVPLAGLVDREDREFEYGPELVVDLLASEHRDGLLYWTRGHSIENYLLRPNIVCRYLRMMYPGQFDLAFFSLVEMMFASALPELVALYRAIADEALLGRAVGLIGRDHWELIDGAPLLRTDAVRLSLESRGVDLGRADACVNRLIAERLHTHSTDSETLRWAGHGHLSTDGLWAMVGHLAAQAGIAFEDCDQITCGHRELKRKYATDLWAKDVETGEATLLELCGWALDQ